MSWWVGLDRVAFRAMLRKIAEDRGWGTFADEKNLVLPDSGDKAMSARARADSWKRTQ